MVTRRKIAIFMFVTMKPIHTLDGVYASEIMLVCLAWTMGIAHGGGGVST